MNVGDEIINKIVEGKLFTVGCAKCDESNCVVLWSSGASEQIEAMVKKEREPMIALLRAAFSAGFRLGNKAGADEAAAYEWGHKAAFPHDADDAWKQDVEPYLTIDYAGRIDPLNPKDWENV